MTSTEGREVRVILEIAEKGSLEAVNLFVRGLARRAVSIMMDGWCVCVVSVRRNNLRHRRSVFRGLWST